MRRGLVSIAVAGSLVCLSFFAPTLPATADDYDQCDIDTGCEPDNHEHTFCWSTNFDTDNKRDAADYAMTNLANETSFTRNYLSTCSTSTDILFRGYNFTNGRLAEYQCLDFVVGGCGQARILLDADAHENDSDREHSMCHEVGHSGGLTHHLPAYDDCMESGHWDGNVLRLHYNSHHEDHLNELD